MNCSKYKAMIAVVLLACVIAFAPNRLLCQATVQVDTLWTRDVLSHGGTMLSIGGGVINNATTMLFIRRARGSGIRPFTAYEVDLATGNLKDSLIIGEYSGEVSDITYAGSSGEFALAFKQSQDVHAIHVWDWNTRQLVSSFTDTNERVDGLEPLIGITSDGRRLFNSVTGSMFDTQTGRKMFSNGLGWYECKPQFTNDNKVMSVAMRYDTALSPNNAYVVRLVDVETGAWLAMFPGGAGGPIRMQNISDDGRYVGVGRDILDGGGSVVIYNRETQNKIMDTTFRDVATSVHPYWILFTPGGRGFFMYGYDRNVWNGEPIIGPAVYRSMGNWLPRQYFGYIGSDKPVTHHTPNWEYVYLITSSQIWLSHIDLEPLATSEENNEVPSPKIAPNPVRDHIVVSGLTTQGIPLNVQITNATGKVVIQDFLQTSNDSIEIDVSRLTPGMYAIQIRSHDRTVFSSTFIKIL